MWNYPKADNSVCGTLFLIYYVFIAAVLLKDGQNTVKSLVKLMGELIKHIPTLHPPPDDTHDEEDYNT